MHNGCWVERGCEAHSFKIMPSDAHGSPAFGYHFPKLVKKSQVCTRDSKENTTVRTSIFFWKNCASDVEFSLILVTVALRVLVLSLMLLIFGISLMVLIFVLSLMVLIFVLSLMVLIFVFSLMVLSFVQGWSMQIFVLRPMFLMLS